MRDFPLTPRIPANEPLTNGTTVQLWECNGDYRQQWFEESDLTIRLRTQNAIYCIDIAGYNVNSGAPVWLYACHTSDKQPDQQNQEFQVRADGTLYNVMSSHCLSATSNSPFNGTSIVMNPCGTNDPTQVWDYNASNGQLSLKSQPNMCLDAGSAYSAPCTPDNPGHAYPYCNYSLPLNQRVADLVGRLQLEEKQGLFGFVASGVPRLGIPAYTWWSEALHGIAYSPGVKFGGSTPYATSFPQVCNTGATFNKSLALAIGTAAGTEGRAMNNQNNAGLTFWAPNINMFRDPRWGRGQETPGEDPRRTSSYVKDFVQGFQNGLEDPGHLKASTCCKHYDAYSLENWNGIDRHHFNAIVTPRDLADTYLPAFESCANRAQSSGVMCSYNAVNGVPSCANSLLMTQYLRNEFGFQGYITSDCGAVGDVLYSHKYTQTIPQTIDVVLTAGMDIDCGGMLQGNLVTSVNSGGVPMSAVDTALTHLFNVQFRLGMFDPVTAQPFKKIPASAVNSPAHQQLALEAARQSMTLLKNERSTLPLDKTKIKSVALLGPNADATNTMQGNYYGDAPYLISPIDGVKMYVNNVNYERGCGISSNSTAGFAAACTAAQQSDATILVMGIDQNIEAEGLDRYQITFPGVQLKFINQMIGCTPANNPFVLLVMSGGPVDLTEVKAYIGVGAIMWVGYPGQSGGQAIADALFGAYNPGGRLSYTIYPGDYVNQISMFDMNMRPNSTTGSPGRSYRFYTGTTVYPFGHGLSYTTFQYEIVGSERSVVRVQDILDGVKEDSRVAGFEIIITNTGKVAGNDAVLAFVVGPDAGRNGNPIRSLVDFERVYINPGANVTILLGVTARDLSVIGEDGKRTVEPGLWTFVVGEEKKLIEVL